MAAFMTRMSTDESGRRAPEAKGHDLPLELAQLRAEARLRPVGLPQPHLVVALGQIELGEPPGAARLVQEGVDVRQRFDLRLP